jgi:hypothetical protein
VFKCELCGKIVPRNVPAQRIVLKTRPASYPERPKANRVKKDGPGVTEIDGKFYKKDPGGTGCEIVREALVCPSCAEKPRR